MKLTLIVEKKGNKKHYAYWRVSLDRPKKIPINVEIPIQLWDKKKKQLDRKSVV